MISITDGLRVIYNSNMREKTPLELERENRLLRQQIDQLTNNWNELEEWLKEGKPNVYCCSKSSQKAFEGAKAMYKIIILNKMKEIKEGNNVSSRN